MVVKGGDAIAYVASDVRTCGSDAVAATVLLLNHPEDVPYGGPEMTVQDLDQRRRALTSRFLEEIVADPGFRQQVVDDPKGALESHGLWEEYNEILAGYNSDAEVSGYASAADSNCCGSNY